MLKKHPSVFQHCKMNFVEQYVTARKKYFYNGFLKEGWRGRSYVPLAAAVPALPDMLQVAQEGVALVILLQLTVPTAKAIKLYSARIRNGYFMGLRG